MPAVAAPVAISKAERRERALEPWIAELRRQTEALRNTSPSATSLTLRVAARILTIDPWSAAGIRASLKAEAEAPRQCSALVIHVTSLRMKIESDRSRLRRSALSRNQELYEIQAELMFDAAMGLALDREIQEVVDSEIRAGRIAPAKHWSRLKNELHGAVAQARRLLAESERKRAEVLTDQLTDRPETEATSRVAAAPRSEEFEIAERRRARLARVRKKASAALALLPSRTELLTAALAVAVAVWLGFVELPDLLAAPLPQLSTKDFPSDVGLTQVRARPPSLYVTVDDAVWAALDRQARKDLVLRVSGVMQAKGYTGALFETSEGRPVARWLTLQGARLIETQEVREIVPPAQGVEGPAEGGEDQRQSPAPTNAAQ